MAPSLGATIKTCIIAENQVTFPVYFGIANSSTPLLLTKIVFEFGCTNTDTGYTNDFLGNPLIQYSDDGTTWTAIPTRFDLQKNNQEASSYRETIIHGSGSHATIEYGDWHTSYPSKQVVTISQYEYATTHKYWRIVFHNGSLQASSGQLNTRITDVIWANPLGTQLFEANTNFGADDIDGLQYAQSENTLYVTSATNKQPMKVVYNNGVFTVSDFTPTNSPNVWTDNDFPAAVAVFQNRLCFAGFPRFRNRVIMSAFGDFKNFTIPTGTVLPTSPISADSLQLKSRIDVLWGGDKALYGLSAEGVAMIDAGGGVVATDQIEFKLRNREPAAAVLPTVKDDIMIYVSRDREKIMVTDYDFVVQRYRAVFLSNKYDNFLQGKIKSIHYIPTKASLIYGLMENGKGFMLLYDQSTEHNALFPFSVAGTITDILPIKYEDTTKLVAVSSYNGIWNLIRKDPQPEMELMDFMGNDQSKQYSKKYITDNVYLDYYMTYDYDVDVDWIPLPSAYTADDVIAVIANGAYIDPLLPTSTTLMVLQSSEYNVNYYVKDIAEGELAWVVDPNNNMWDLYGTLHIENGVMSVNNIEVEDTGQTSDIFCCNLEHAAKTISFGMPYGSYAAIKLVTPYAIRKFPREIAVNFINTGYLELGNTFDSLQPALGNTADTITLDNSPVLMNGNYEKTLDKQAFETPYVIVNSEKGLPFMITGIDYEVDYSNYQGGV